MAGIKSAREEFESEKTYLSNAELVDTQTEFCVLNANLEDGVQFGPTWTLTIVYLDGTGEHNVQSLYLSAGTKRNGVYKENSYRRWFFTKKAVYPIHHVVLVQGIANNGFKFNDIEDAPASIDPCPCMTGDFIASATNGLLHRGTNVVEADDTPDGAMSDTEREHYMEGIYNLSNKMGWPTDMEMLKAKSDKELKKLYRNFGMLAQKQS